MIPLLPHNLDQLGPEHVRRLVAERTAEQRSLDYKESLPGSSDDAKKEFLADLASFANAAGGFLIYGVSERRDNGKKTGEPEAVVGVPGPADEVVRRLEQVACHGLAPRVPGLNFRWLDAVDGDKAVLLVRVPRSWAGPHMVCFKGSSRFFSRTSMGKYQLDVQEIRAAFLAGADVERHLRAFRDERLGRVLARETPVPLSAGPVVVVHLLRMSQALAREAVDLADLDSGKLQPLATGEWNGHHCYEGYVADGGFGGGYALLFRSGAIEATVGLSASSGTLYPNQVECVLNEAMRLYPRLLLSLGIEPPIVVSVALLNARGAKGPSPRWRFRNDGVSVIEDVLVFPDVLAESRDFEPGALLRPTCDAIWQAFGFSQSGSYEDGGRWDPEKVSWGR